MPSRERGRVVVNPRGFGFLQLEEPGAGGGPRSAFIAPPELNPLLADDVVSATLVESGEGRFTATALTLCERPRRLLFGEVLTRRGLPFLRVDREVANTDWELELGGAAAPAVGSQVLAEVQGGRARLSRVVAPPGDASADLSLWQIIARYGLQSEPSAAEQAEAQALRGRAHDPSGGRRDLRQVPTMTVDAASTRDIDDAISVLPADQSGGLRVLVSIADVAEFVAVGGALDQGARARGTSVYLAGRVLPMLPESLSADWLSLMPGVERCALTVELRLLDDGEIAAVDLYPSLLRSHARATYEELAAYLDHGQVSDNLTPLRASLPWLRAAQARLQVARERRGGVAMHSEDARVVLDALTGAPTALEVTQPSSAHKLIERFMVAANEAVARWLHDRGVPTLYRVHDQPTPEDVADLAAAARRFGYEAAFGRRLTPLALRAFDVQIAGAACEPALRSVLRRSLGPARYTMEPAPHFGLAAPLYLHYTSPIRRYADLCVHRSIRAYLQGQRDFAREQEELPEIAAALNRQSRAAARAEGDRHRVLVARYLSSRIGEVHDAHVTRVRPFGLLVQIDATLAEGLLPLEALPGGPYRVDPRETEARAAGGSFAVGQALRVRVAAADPLVGRVEFALQG